MIAKHLSIYIYIYIYPGTPLYIKKIIVLILSAYSSLLVRYKVYTSDPKECLCTRCKVNPMYNNLKPIIQHHAERIL